MILNIVVIAAILLIAYMWTAKGLFSALIQFVCTLVAGAIAFGVWEFVTNKLLLGLWEDGAWTLGLILPFLASLFVLRLITDKVIIANIELDDTSNFVGGGLFGAATGVISVGILVLGAGFMRVEPAILGYQAVETASQGYIARKDKLWLPADMLTVRVYEWLSVASLSTGSPLAERQPDVHLQAAALRQTFNDNSRTAYKRADFDVIGQYTVAGSDLFNDSFTVDRQSGDLLGPQRVFDISGEALSPGATELFGVVLKLNAGAREKSGQVVMGPGQIRVVGVDASRQPFGAHAIAVITQTAGDALQYGRFRFDGQGVFVASVGGASQTTMGFEFPIPAGATVTDVLVKNVRVPSASIPPISVAPADGFTPQARDEAIRSLALINAESASGPTGPNTGLDRTSTTSASGTTPTAGGPRSAIRQSNAIPIAFHRQSKGNLEVNEENEISGGHHKFSRSSLTQRNISSKFRVASLAQRPGVKTVLVDVGLESAFSLFGKSVQMAQDVAGAPTLIDNLGQRYQAIGWIYEESDTVDIRVTPDQPVRALREVPNLSRTRTDQKLTLIFDVTAGVSVVEFAIGNKVITTLDTPLVMRTF